jgi:hypothetical protein
LWVNLQYKTVNMLIVTKDDTSSLAPLGTLTCKTIPIGIFLSSDKSTRSSTTQELKNVSLHHMFLTSACITMNNIAIQTMDRNEISYNHFIRWTIDWLAYFTSFVSKYGAQGLEIVFIATRIIITKLMWPCMPKSTYKCVLQTNCGWDSPETPLIVKTSFSDGEVGNKMYS